MGVGRLARRGLGHAPGALDIDRQESGRRAGLHQACDVDDQVCAFRQPFEGVRIGEPAHHHFSSAGWRGVWAGEDPQSPAAVGQGLAERPAEEAGGAGQGRRLAGHVRR